MVQYDPQVLVQFAERLYREATFIIIRYSILGLLVGALAGGIGGAFVGSLAGNADVLFAIFGVAAFGALFTAIGLMMGRERAFALKLQAQTALCQLQIEINTRRV